MAPGCSTITNDHSQLISHYTESTSAAQDQSNKPNQIPLPSSPAPQKPKVIKKSPSFRTLDTVDSFEILEQTIMKQKRLGRTKNSDLRMKILLKRTFNLVCEMMDQENGYESTNSSTTEEPTIDCLDLDSQEKESDLQETLIINLNESECLDSQFQVDETELNYIDLENFNYGQLLENENSSLGIYDDGSANNILDKNQSFLTNDFFSNTESVRGNKRRRSSADDDLEFDEDFESNDNSYYLFNDLTNSSSNSNKKRCIETSSNGAGYNKKYHTESINIVT